MTEQKQIVALKPGMFYLVPDSKAIRMPLTSQPIMNGGQAGELPIGSPFMVLACTEEKSYEYDPRLSNSGDKLRCRHALVATTSSIGWFWYGNPTIRWLDLKELACP